MQRPFTPPDELRQFIRALPIPPAPETAPRTDDSASTWPEPDNPGDSTAGPQAFPPSPAWLAARDAYISHVMACPQCVTSGPKVPRHCPEGATLRQHYDATPFTPSRD